MIQIKKTILTLVALLAVTTGAWADGIVCTASDLGKVLCTDGSIYENVSAATTAGKTAEAVIAYVDETNKNGLALALTDEDAMTWDNSAPSNKGKTAPEICSALNTSKAVTGGTWKLPSRNEWKQMFSANGGKEGSYTGLNTAIGNAGGTALKESEEYWSSSEVYDDAWRVYLDDGNAYWDTYGKHYQRCVRACLAFDIAASSGPEVAWDKAKKTGTFKMPGGNVTLEPEYYPQATLAFQGLTAAEDAAAKTEAPLAVLAENAVTGGTLMYFVIYDENFSQADAIALAEDEWEAAIPTAETIEAAGTYYVWYYIKGDDEHSDTDPQRLIVTVLPEPTYNVEFAEGTNNAPNKWTATPNPAKKGQQVTVTYEGPRKVMGVKAEKKAAGLTYPIALSAVTADYLGSVVTSDGNVYPAKTAVPAGKTAVGILGKVTSTGHGLILALKDAAQQNWNTINGWTSETTYAGTTLKLLPDDAARGTNLTSYTALGEIAVSNWAVAQKSDYEAIFINLGSTTGDSDGIVCDANVNDYITGVGGAAISDYYCSATEGNDFSSWNFGIAYWNYYEKESSSSVRPVLGF